MSTLSEKSTLGPYLLPDFAIPLQYTMSFKYISCLFKHSKPFPFYHDLMQWIFHRVRKSGKIKEEEFLIHGTYIFLAKRETATEIAN